LQIDNSAFVRSRQTKQEFIINSRDDWGIEFESASWAAS
jgi:hypothetical protein